MSQYSDAANGAKTQLTQISQGPAMQDASGFTGDDTVLPCTCRSGLSYALCCAPFVTGQAQAATAEALMRSRYTAYSRGEAAYLFETQHPDGRKVRDLADVTESIRRTEWTNLIILATSRGGEDDSEGIVEFVAASRSKAGGPMQVSSGDFAQMHERSRFVRENGRWYYADGDMLAAYEPKRNDPCWCGSGKKFKQCHG